MQRYLMAMIESFYSKDLYREVAHKWGGIAGLYLFLALLICWLPGIYNMYGYQNLLSSVFNDNTDYRAMLIKFPTIKVVGGHLSIDQETPYAIRDPASNQPLIVFDTKNELKSLSAFPHGVVVTDKSITVKFKDGTVKPYYLNEAHTFTVDAKKLVRFYDLRWVWFAAIIFPVLVVGSWLGRTCFAIGLAIFSLIFAYFFDAKLTYLQCIPMTQVAMTPALILSTVLEAFNFQHPVLIFTYVTMTLGYILFAVIANRDWLGTEMTPL